MDWTAVLPELVKQIPLVAVCVIFAVIVFRHQAKQHTEILKALTEQQDRHTKTLAANQEGEVKRFVEQQKELLASKDAEIERLVRKEESLWKMLKKDVPT